MDYRHRLTRSLAVIRVLFAFALVVACRGSHDAPPPARRAFYFWRTAFELTPAERQAVRDLRVERIYLRVFDVDWRDSAVATLGPVSGAAPTGVEIVPVVYVKTAVLEHTDPAQIPALAGDVWRHVQDRARAVGFAIHEVQLDCDWTDSTRDRFFALIRAIKSASHVAMSATIRLHQVKYRERTGVPPVDRGMLMFYNMGRFSADPDARMIFDGDSAAKYLGRLASYPLALDVALPIWSWTVHTRDGIVVGLLQSTDPAKLPGLDFVRGDGADRFVVTRDAFLHGELLREGDVLKVEVTGPAETRAAAAMLAPKLAATHAPRTLTLFDLSERNLARHGITALDTEFRSLR